MGSQDRRRRSRSGRLLDALVWGTALGAAAGAALGAAIDGLGAGPGALIGVLLYAPAEAFTTMRRGAAEVKPLWQRIFSSALLMALFGWLLGVIGLDEPLLVAIVSGALLGLLGLRPLKLALGLLVGAAWARCSRRSTATWTPALVAAAVAIVYRVIAAVAYRNRPLVRVMAEEVPASELRYVVPFEARSRYVGADYVEQLAKVRGGTFRRNPPDVGILASLDSLDGPAFDAARVHPLIREFYEHTSRFRLSIVPEWRQLDEARLRGLQARGRRAARPGRDPVEHRGSPARDGQHDRHDRPRRRRGDRHPRLDPHVRRLGQADLRRHLHELPARRPRLRERRLPDPQRQLHRDPGAPQQPASTTSCSRRAASCRSRATT